MLMPGTDQFHMVYSVSPRRDTPAKDTTRSPLGRQFRNIKRNVVAYRGRCVVTAPADDFYGGDQSQAYVSRVLTDPTWGQLFACARAQQRKTLDLHHSFFEGFYVRGTVDTPKGPVANLHLSLGS
jgi:hypothetical protein